MRGLYYRYLVVLVRFLPFALAFLRDRRRFLLFGPPRRPDEKIHHQRAERIRDTLLELGPAFIKVGQVLSTRPDIVPPTYATVFGTLQDEVPEGVGGDPLTVLEEELGDEIDTMSADSVAGGSLAFVYAASYDGGRIALKVRRPGVKAVVERDLRVMAGFVPLIAALAPERQQYSIRNVADDFEEIILDELDFERERTMMAEIRNNFADDDRVVIPATLEELSSDRVLAMEYRAGRKITDDDAFDGVDVDAPEMAQRIVDVYLEMGVVDGIFHADPHPGNLAVTDDGRLLIYDFGMSEHLPPTVQEHIVGLYRALVRRDVDGLVDALVALDVLDPGVDRTEVGRILQLVIENLQGRPEITWRAILTEMTSMLRDFPFRIPPDVMLLIRVGTVGEGVCRELDPEFDFLEAVRSFLVEQGLIETEFQALLDETTRDLQTALPALLRTPARLERTVEQLERGDILVRTEAVDDRRTDPYLGYAVLAGALLVAGSVLSLQEGRYALLAFALATGFVLAYLLGRHFSA
ncbi:ABC-1 domain-containing protein [Halalkaliarchaeum desulfuricum]|uniref:ABC-1 domain-containing protein n=1 Tax=Halalkaliarchaeum desulfuricum TaxID=2055893 RepID=A0A343TFM1_9EURY|nr:AarF/UbiB family protein [Halalkaliarchaeum desulfuricum]AUX07893.1 ABC-1 domain-containing protein [Halalkaliarchaeum desulfuricum]